MRRAALLLAGLALPLVVAGCALDEARAAGVTERWLTAVGDQGKENLFDKSEKRAARYGRQELAAEVIPPNAEEDERHFSDFEVGKAVETGDTARVPFRLTARLEGGDTTERVGTAVLVRGVDGWFVDAIVSRAAGEQVPSEGGARPASATVGHWLGTAVLGIVVVIVSAVVISRQPESTAGAGPA